MDRLLIIMPIPDARLSQNGRTHWIVAHKIKAEARGSARITALAALGKSKPPKWGKVRVDVAYFWKTAAKRDRDNARARLKSVFDGFTDAGIWDDDSAIVDDSLSMGKDAKNPRVEITITPVAGKGRAT